MSKTLQNIANHVEFSKEQHMLYFNDLLRQVLVVTFKIKASILIKTFLSLDHILKQEDDFSFKSLQILKQPNKAVVILWLL